MVAAGAALAVAAGIGYNVSAALEKREAVQVELAERSFAALLRSLISRRWWLAAVAIGLLGWAAQITALALAPVVLVMPLMGSGAALLVALGIRWLGERFGRAEIWALVMVVAGCTAVAISSAGIASARTTLSVFSQLAVAAGCAAAAFFASRRSTGVRLGMAAGALYAATAVYSKMIGDLFAVHGLHAIPRVLTSPALWIMIAMSGWALALVNAGFQRANAASVAASMTAVDSVIPILAGYVLFHEKAPHSGALVLMVVGLVGALGGTTMLGAASARREAAAPTMPAREPVAKPAETL